MFKRILILLCVVLLLFTCSCTNSNTSNESGDSQQVTEPAEDNAETKEIETEETEPDNSIDSRTKVYTLEDAEAESEDDWALLLKKDGDMFYSLFSDFTTSVTKHFVIHEGDEPEKIKTTDTLAVFDRNANEESYVLFLRVDYEPTIYSIPLLFTINYYDKDNIKYIV